MEKTYTIVGMSPRLSVSDREYRGTIAELKKEFNHIPSVKKKNFRSIHALIDAINRHYKGREDEYIYRWYFLSVKED